jgi:cation diffusion facilitator CzcD-associated flavoprotein CzcO
VTVAIIGSGFAGLGMALRLQDEGFDDFVILERGSDVGGTWRDNTYPGAACDIPSHLYSLSFAPKRDWTRAYSPQPEIWEYLRGLVERFGLRDRIRFGADVVRAEWDEVDHVWHLTTADGATLTAAVVVNGIGFLRDPAIPSFPGQDEFAGPQFHTCQWDHEVDLAGKRVAVIGTGASAIQIVPAIADEVAHLTVFQRTAPWVVPSRDRAYSQWERRLYRRVPGLAKLNRALTYLQKEIRYPLVFATRERPVRIAEKYVRRWLAQQVADHELRAAVTPDFRLGCKRVVISSDWYPTLQRDDVTLETTGIDRFTPSGVVLADGREIDLDVVVYGTGFRANRPLGTMDVIGRGGRDLAEYWGPRPTAHLGVSVPGFPNMFTLLGPNTGLGHNSVVIMVEAEIEYVLKALRMLRAEPELAALEVTQQAHDTFVAEVDRRHGGQTWASGCHSWYLNDEGDNFAVWPGSTVSYRRRLRRFDHENYLRVRAGRLSGSRTA